MKDSNIYVPLWEKYRPAIVSKIKEAAVEAQTFQLPKHEFEAIGERLKSGYGFNLVIDKGVLQNNIDGSAVARDLLEVLKTSPSATAALSGKIIKINLTKDFNLIIQSK